MSTDEKQASLEMVAKDKNISFIGHAKYRIGSKIVHVRFCSENHAAPTKYKFNINPNSLSADYELWVCGSAHIYYLIPLAIIRAIYDDPETYVDRHHPDIRIVSIDTSINAVIFASGGKKESLETFLNASL